MCGRTYASKGLHVRTDAPRIPSVVMIRGIELSVLGSAQSHAYEVHRFFGSKICEENFWNWTLVLTIHWN